MSGIKSYNKLQSRVGQNRLKMARDYHMSEKSAKEIAKEYNVNENTIYRAKDVFSREDVKQLYGKSECIFIFNSRDFGSVYQALNDLGFVFREPSDNHTLIERYESSMNQ